MVNTFYSHSAALSQYAISPHVFPCCLQMRIKENCQKTEIKTNGTIRAFLFHVVTSGCDANNEVDSSQHNWAHPDRFGDRIIFVEFLHVAPKLEKSPSDLPAK